MAIDFKNNLSIELSGSYFMRDTHYSYHPDKHVQTFELRAGLTYHF